MIIYVGYYDSEYTRIVFVTKDKQKLEDWLKSETDHLSAFKLFEELELDKLP